MNPSNVADIDYHAENTIKLIDDDKTYQFIGGEKKGSWAGTCAALLGLTGEIEEELYLKLMKGIDPRTGHPMYQQNGRKHKHATDNSLSPDKSVSVVWARSRPRQRLQIESAHHQSVLETLKFLEVHAAYTRRGHDGIEHQKVPGFISALFQHSTSRAEDPHLHSHLVIFNCCKRYDGTNGTLESRYIFTWQKAASLVYQATFAEKLRDLGFDTISDGQSFKIWGVPEWICKYFSKRRKQIIGALETMAIQTARAAALIAKMTRGKKKPIDRPKLFENWKTYMDQAGFTEERLIDLHKKSLGMHLPNENDLTSIKFNHKYLSEVLIETVSIFSEVDVFKVALSTAMRLAIPATLALKLAENYLETELVIELQTGNKYLKQFTTHEMREQEHRLIRNSQSLHKKKFLPGLSITDIFTAQEKTGLILSEEQQEAVLGVLGNASFEIMSGSAGAGKSTAMRIVASIYKSKLICVWGAAIAKDAAKNLEQETGVKSFTIAKLLIDLDNGWSKIKNGDVVIIDEAGQVGVRTMLKLQEHAILKGFKVILTGEDKQLDAIEHGGVLRYLSRSDVIGTTRIETIRRQRKEWDRIAVANFRDGNAIDALSKYQEHGRLHFSTDIDSTYSKLVHDWNIFQQQNPNKGTMVLARKWKDVLELNRLIRNQLQEAGKIGKQDVKVNGTVSSREIEFLLSINDRIRFTDNNASLNFINGDTGTVTNISKSDGSFLRITIKKDNGQLVTVLQEKYSNDKGNIYLAPAYAQTIYSSQGKTIDGNVYVLHDPMIDRANAYVALSRHKDDCQLYAATESILDEDEELLDKAVKENLAIDKIAAQYSSEKRASLSIEYETVQREKDIEIEKQEKSFEELTI